MAKNGISQAFKKPSQTLGRITLLAPNISCVKVIQVRRIWPVMAEARALLLLATQLSNAPTFSARFLNAGYANVLRGETTSNGIANIPELGSVKTEEGFKALRVMDTYQNVKDGLAYPAILLSHGINDSRVPSWMSAKMTARLQAATSNDKPILLRIDYDAGHGVGSTRQQRNEEQADIYAFLFQQLGN